MFSKFVYKFLSTLLFTILYLSCIGQDSTGVSTYLPELPDSSIIIPNDSILLLTDTIGDDSLSVTVLEISEDAVDAPIDYQADDSLLFD
ncbi:MAG: hypothetical protein ABIJ16_08890, partial [Bacteroidota bacterium]